VTPSSKSAPGCRAGILTGYSAQFVGDTSVSVEIYELLTSDLVRGPVRVPQPDVGRVVGEQVRVIS